MNREMFRNVLKTQSTLVSLINEFNKTSDDVKITSNRGAMLVKGLDEIADFYGFDVEDTGHVRFIKLMDVVILEDGTE